MNFRETNNCLTCQKCAYLQTSHVYIIQLKKTYLWVSRWAPGQADQVPEAHALAVLDAPVVKSFTLNIINIFK